LALRLKRTTDFSPGFTGVPIAMRHHLPQQFAATALGPFLDIGGVADEASVLGLALWAV